MLNKALAHALPWMTSKLYHQNWRVLSDFRGVTPEPKINSRLSEKHIVLLTDIGSFARCENKLDKRLGKRDGHNTCWDECKWISWTQLRLGRNSLITKARGLILSNQKRPTSIQFANRFHTAVGSRRRELFSEHVRSLYPTIIRSRLSTCINSAMLRMLSWHKKLLRHCSRRKDPKQGRGCSAWFSSIFEKMPLRNEWSCFVQGNKQIKLLLTRCNNVKV